MSWPKKEVECRLTVALIASAMNIESQTNHEVEIKLDLGSFTNYLKLVGFLGQLDREERQANGFFDTEDHRLGEEGWALRMRADDARGVVTVKGRDSGGDFATVRAEVESEVPRNDALEVLNLQRDIMNLDVSAIRWVRQRWGELSVSKYVQYDNTRQHKSFRFGDYTYDLEIDTTHFADGSVEYELEVELPNEGQAIVVLDRLRKLFHTLDIPFLKQERSKLARALARTFRPQ